VELKLRFDGETDQQFRRRAERAAVIARVLVRAALENACVQDMIADPSLPYTEKSVRKNPPLRVEYEQVVAIGDLGSCLSSTKGKNWGDGPWVMPLSQTIRSIRVASFTSIATTAFTTAGFCNDNR
jgi:hypothetical protein